MRSEITLDMNHSVYDRVLKAWGIIETEKGYVPPCTSEIYLSLDEAIGTVILQLSVGIHKCPECERRFQEDLKGG